MRGSFLALAASLALLTACATTEQTRNVELSGFLKDYEELDSGRRGQALRIYIDPGADFSLYDRVMIDPVTIWIRESSDASGAPREELQQLADSLETMLRNQLALDFEIATQPEPRTMRIRTALTEAQQSNVVLDIVSTILPPARITGAIGRLATGTHAFVGSAAIEMEIVDAISGRRLIAAADERSGRKTLRGSTDAWADVHDAFEYWADAVRSRLATLRRFDIAEAQVDAAEREGISEGSPEPAEPDETSD